MTLTFACKDPVIVAHCEARFRRQFERQLDGAVTRDHLEQCQRVWARALRKEAARQEWYDYTETDGIRRVIYTHGSPHLLIPEVIIE